MMAIDTRKRNLWLSDPHCHWCGVLTVLRRINRQHPPTDNTATKDHLKDRPWGQRTHTTVLACYKCNNRRSKGGA